MKTRRYSIERGKPHPLGATPDGGGVNFSIYSENANYVELLLFDKHNDPEPAIVLSTSKADKRTRAGRIETSMKLLESNEIYKATNIALNKTFHFWHVYVCGLKPGIHYAYRIGGPFDPPGGYRFDGDKVLIDPYSKGNNKTLWNREKACLPGDNLAFSMRSVVINTSQYESKDEDFIPSGKIYEVSELSEMLPSKKISQELNEIIIYELHVGGFTRSPTSGVTASSTFLGVIEKIPYLKELGITAVELMPVFDFDDATILDGRKQYWGYDPICFLLLTAVIV